MHSAQAMRNTIFALLFITTLLGCKGQSEDPGQPATDTTNTAATTDTTMTATGSMSTAGTVSDLSPDDKEFIVKAGMGGLAEVQMGTAGAGKATNAEVKAFAQRMVTDHGTANGELQILATAKGVGLPTELDGDHKSGLDHVNGLSGAEFDKTFMQHMVSDHEKAVADFSNASQNAKDAELKAWAVKTLPTLQDHLKQAQALNAKLP